MSDSGSPRAPESIASRVMPLDIVDFATSRDVQTFLSMYGDTLLVVVRIPEGEVDLASGLSSTAVRGSDGTRVKPALGAMQFQTQHHSVAVEARADSFRRPAHGLRARLREGSHFVVPLRKRTDVDAAFTDRISIGRAINKDIVLRHSSVSKFHAWLEIDENDTFHLADADSKNSTWVNGESLVSRQLVPVAPGDLLRFGSVEAALVAPRELWEALNAAPESTRA